MEGGDDIPQPKDESPVEK
jgi:hypothetical protein